MEPNNWWASRSRCPTPGEVGFLFRHLSPGSSDEFLASAHTAIVGQKAHSFALTTSVTVFMLMTSKSLALVWCSLLSPRPAKPTDSLSGSLHLNVLWVLLLLPNTTLSHAKKTKQNPTFQHYQHHWVKSETWELNHSSLSSPVNPHKSTPFSPGQTITSSKLPPPVT